MAWASKRGPGRAIAAALAVVAVLSSSCGRAAPNATLAAAVNALAPIHSGVLQTEAIFIGSPTASGGGFNIYGPFAEPLHPGGPPVTHLNVAVVGPNGRSTALISDGRKVVVERSGVVYPVAGQALRALGYSTNADLVGLEAMAVAYWGTKPVQTRTTGGVTTVDARPDPVAAINGIVSLAKEVGVGDGFHSLGGGAASTVRRDLRSGSFSLRYGAADHLLRFFWVQLSFRASALPALRQSLGSSAGTLITLSVSVFQANQPQRVTVPPPSPGASSSA